MQHVKAAAQPASRRLGHANSCPSRCAAMPAVANAWAVEMAVLAEAELPSCRRFCPNDDDILASSSKDGVAAIWRLTEEEDSDAAISSTCLLKIRMSGHTGA